MGWKKRIDKARRLHRPSLSTRDWQRDGMAESFPDYVETVSQQKNYSVFQLAGSLEKSNLPVLVDANQVSDEEFASQYEARGIPTVIRNIPERGWKARSHWQLDHLEQDLDLRDRYFKCGEDDDGRSVKVRLKHFMKYMSRNDDDSPLYIFDSSFDEDKRAKKLLSDYAVPSYFREDLFGFISESRRPPYRWFLVGPERSGTTVHVDPLGTSAWNTLIVGAKRWVLFPPHLSKSIVTGRRLVRDDEDDEAIHYFVNILPRILRQASNNSSHPDYKNFACYEFTQHAGETVFIPNGWWHAVLNLSDTVGVTQNFCSPRNFDQVWVKTRNSRKRMAWKLLMKLDEHYPHLAERARAMNKRDGFVMKYDPAEIQRREEEERRKRDRERRDDSRNTRHKTEKANKTYQRDCHQGASSSSGGDYRDCQRTRLVSPN